MTYKDSLNQNGSISKWAVSLELKKRGWSTLFLDSRIRVYDL